MVRSLSRLWTLSLIRAATMMLSSTISWENPISIGRLQELSPSREKDSNASVRIFILDFMFFSFLLFHIIKGAQEKSILFQLLGKNTRHQDAKSGHKKRRIGCRANGNVLISRACQMEMVSLFVL